MLGFFVNSQNVIVSMVVLGCASAESTVVGVSTADRRHESEGTTAKRAFDEPADRRLTVSAVQYPRAMTWRDTQSNYDEIEWRNRELLNSDLPAYLDFHERHLGHLPKNFAIEASGDRLPESDMRYVAITRIGFYSYAILVNLVLLDNSITELPGEFSSAIEVYDHAGRFFLRAGAATDIATQLAREAEQDFDHHHTRFSRHTLGANGSLALDLEKTLGAVNAYNNSIKHNGLPALAVDGSGKDVRVLIPEQLAWPRSWAEQKPTAEMADVFKAYRPKVFAAFQAFYSKLADDVPRRLADWRVRRATTVRGILDVRATGSGSVDLSDGYMPVWPTSVRS